MSVNINTMLAAKQESLTKQDLIDIYEKHSPGIYRYAVRLLGDSATAEDCVSETFSRFLNAIRRGGGPKDNTRAYLYRVAHNWVTDYYRRQPPPELPLEPDQHVEPGSNPATLALDAWERERVRKAILNLPAEQQMVIQLRFLEDWSHEEVAQVLDKTVEATRAMQYRALNSLRRILIANSEEESNEQDA